MPRRNGQKDRKRGAIAQRAQPLPLTDRQKQVLDLARKGKSTKEIGAKLGINPNGVNVHLSRIREKGWETGPGSITRPTQPSNGRHDAGEKLVEGFLRITREAETALAAEVASAQEELEHVQREREAAAVVLRGLEEREGVLQKAIENGQRACAAVGSTMDELATA